MALSAVASLTVAFGIWQLNTIRPAKSRTYQAWVAASEPGADRGAALLAFGDFGALDLDTLETAALPWPILATALAMRESGGTGEHVHMDQVAIALKRFGFLFPKAIVGHPDLKLSRQAPLGLTIGVLERSVPPIRMTAMTLGCASCHAGPAYRSDGSVDPDAAVLGRPNTAIDLEAFSTQSYAAVKHALQDEASFSHAMAELFPQMSHRERLTLKWIALPSIRKKLSELASHMDRPSPFHNGAPGLTNGVAALKVQLGVAPKTEYRDGAGFVSIPDLSDRSFRSALLADGAYAPKGSKRFHTVTRAEAAARDQRSLAAIASFFMVPTMGLTSERAEGAIPDLTEVLTYLARNQSPSFPGIIDQARATQGKRVYDRACAACHGHYDDNIQQPKLTTFPNWAGRVGTDTSRIEAFNSTLKSAVDATRHGQRHLDAATTGVIAAPLLSGLWASAPYFTNGSVPTLRHLLEPQTRPVRFMTGGHKLDFGMVGVAGVPSADGSWMFPADYTPYSKPVLIDTTKPGFSNSGHEKEVEGLNATDRANLLEYLKLL